MCRGRRARGIMGLGKEGAPETTVQGAQLGSKEKGRWRREVEGASLVIPSQPGHPASRRLGGQFPLRGTPRGQEGSPRALRGVTLSPSERQCWLGQECSRLGAGGSGGSGKELLHLHHPISKAMSWESHGLMTHPSTIPALPIPPPRQSLFPPGRASREDFAPQNSPVGDGEDRSPPSDTEEGRDPAQIPEVPHPTAGLSGNHREQIMRQGNPLFRAPPAMSQHHPQAPHRLTCSLRDRTLGKARSPAPGPAGGTDLMSG